MVNPPKPGDHIAYMTFGGTVRRIKVTGHREDIKNGQPGFDAINLDDGQSVWGYDDQIV